jgi:hypothetical protein
LLPEGFLLLGVGILLLGAAVAVVEWMAWKDSYSYPFYTFFNWSLPSAEMRAACGFLCVVFGLSGLICTVLGLVRLLARKKGT